jgi:hypothetical protein
MKEWGRNGAERMHGGDRDNTGDNAELELTPVTKIAKEDASR